MSNAQFPQPLPHSPDHPTPKFRNTGNAYGGIAKLFHWATAALILVLVPLGFAATQLAKRFQANPETVSVETLTTLFSIHKTLGVMVFFVALGRIIWALIQPKPKLLHGDRRLEAFAAETVHWALYGSLVAVPLSGWIHHAATRGFAPIWWPFGQGLPLIPQSPQLSELFSTLHFFFVLVMVASLLLHIAGAAKHHIIDRDATLRRMLPGRTTAQPSAHQPSHWPSLLTAGALLILPVGLSADLSSVAAPAPVELEQPSQWQVAEGQLSLEIQQLGSTVAGQFDQWSAAITYDPALPGPEKGAVDVQIVISSLTLGSVSDQAMGADYFDTSTHPTAQFQATLREQDNQLVADGTLTVKSISTPLILPVTLTLQDAPDQQIALASGAFTLDRRTFDIGGSVPDEGTLGFEVHLNFSLKAQKNTP